MWKITSMLAVTCLLLPGRADAIRGRFGLEVGANYASLDHRSGTGPYSAHWQWHPCGDVEFDIALPRRFRFVPSLRYQEQGEKVGIAPSYRLSCPERAATRLVRTELSLPDGIVAHPQNRGGSPVSLVRQLQQTRSCVADLGYLR